MVSRNRHGRSQKKAGKAAQAKETSAKARKKGLPKSLAADADTGAGDTANVKVIREAACKGWNVPEALKPALVDYQVALALDPEKPGNAVFAFGSLLRGEELEVKKRLADLKEREVELKLAELEQRKREARDANDALRDLSRHGDAVRALELLEAVAAASVGEGAESGSGRLRPTIPMAREGHEPARIAGGDEGRAVAGGPDPATRMLG